MLNVIDSMVFFVLVVLVVLIACWAEMCGEHVGRSADVEPRDNWDE